MSEANPSNSEWLTRKQRIDPRLQALGWIVTPYELAKPLSAYGTCAIVEFPTDSGPADYALCVGGRIVGIVEAKKLSLGPQNVLTQAERYSRGLKSNPLDFNFNFNGFRVPFLYATNGEVIWFHDVRHPLNRSRQVASFHTPTALTELLARDFAKECEWLVNTPDTNPRLRPYQRDANAAAEKAILDRKRQMLQINLTDWLVMCLRADNAQRQMRVHTRATSQPDLGLENIREIVVPLPSLAEQQEIVRRVEALFRLADAMEKRVAAARQRADKLTQAVLARAFRGELVPPEAESARQEGRDYEPASALLDRIRAERAVVPIGVKSAKAKPKRAGTFVTYFRRHPFTLSTFASPRAHRHTSYRIPSVVYRFFILIPLRCALRFTPSSSHTCVM